MIRGLGNDILEISRIRKAIEKHGNRFLKKIFHADELNVCLKHRDPIPSLTGRFAAKEAIAKAMGTGLGSSIAFLDIAICNDPLGRPHATFSDAFNRAFDNPHIIISISHCKNYASAVAIWVS